MTSARNVRMKNMRSISGRDSAPQSCRLALLSSSKRRDNGRLYCGSGGKAVVYLTLRRANTIPAAFEVQSAGSHMNVITVIIDIMTLHYLVRGRGRSMAWGRMGVKDQSQS